MENGTGQGMKILISSNVYPPNFIGGAELITHQQAKVLRNAGHEVVVCAGDIGGRVKRYECVREKYDSLDVYRIGLLPEDYHPERLNFFHRKVEERFSELLESFSPDVVHLHNVVGLSVGLISLSRDSGAKTVVTLHDYWAVCPKNTILDSSGIVCLDYNNCDKCIPSFKLNGGLQVPARLRRDYIDLQAQEVDVFVSPSRYLADAHINAGFPREKFRVIWNGIDVQRFSKIRKKEAEGRVIRFSFIGHFGKHKGIAVLLEAMKLVSEKNRFRVNFVGIGEELDRTRRHVREMGLRRSVKYWGRVGHDRIETVYQETDVLILPSIWPENHPGTITESMSSRTPVIASAIGGIPELLHDGVTGWLFEAGNANQLAQKMEYFIANKKSIPVFGERAFQRIKNNTFENHVKKIVEIYGEPDTKSELCTKAKRKVICIGKGFTKMHTHALRIFSENMECKEFLFVMFDWITDIQMNDTDVCWVLDDAWSLEEAFHVSQKGIPLLVPETNRELTNFCKSQKAGLNYSDPYKAALYLKHLLLSHR
jgi:glycosyltransferase involved in cell wall biosynthesis